MFNFLTRHQPAGLGHHSAKKSPDISSEPKGGVESWKSHSSYNLQDRKATLNCEREGGFAYQAAG
jgi:hypothetical protein